MTTEQTPTSVVYGELDKAYDMFNDALFDGKLPRCLITLQRKKNVYGYFCEGVFGELAGQKVVDEIALNPQYTNFRSPVETLATLVHEMVHLWQHHFGKVTPTNHHNREWGGEMRRIGLPPTGTGMKVTHTIDPEGLFMRIVDGVLAECDIEALAEIPATEPRKAGRKSGKYVKYVCPRHRRHGERQARPQYPHLRRRGQRPRSDGRSRAKGEQQMSDYKPLLEKTEDQVHVDLDPRDAIKLVRRLRGVTFFLRLEGRLITERNEEEGTYRCYDLPESIDVSARQAVKALTKWAEFNDRKAEAGKAVGRVEVTRLGDCLFIG